jgi:hypothetical protein
MRFRSTRARNRTGRLHQGSLTCTSPAERKSLLVDAREAELVVFHRCVEFHRERLGFTPSREAYEC